MKAQFENKNLAGFTGKVLVDANGLPKVYTSTRVANRTAEKLGARVVKNVKRFIVVI